VSEDNICCRHPHLRQELVDAISLDLIRGVQFLLVEGDSNEPCQEVEVIVDAICNEKPYFRIQSFPYVTDPCEEE
jgi:hypothetical protein|tara:strand:- start:13550 stop:13774 length:225 start_codon:yes stop_codon:yes gene_type:complete